MAASTTVTLAVDAYLPHPSHTICVRRIGATPNNTESTADIAAFVVPLYIYAAFTNHILFLQKLLLQLAVAHRLCPLSPYPHVSSFLLC